METITEPTGQTEDVFDYLEDFDIDVDTREIPVAGTAIIFDIETGPLPWADIEPYFEPPAAPGEFDESSVKTGNLKDPAKIAEKIASAKAAHAAEVAGHAAAIEAAKAEFIGRAALSPLTGRVLAIGYLCDSAASISCDSTTATGDEAGILTEFWDAFSRNGFAPAVSEFVGFNIFGFDLPFLIRRSWALRVDVPPDVLRDRRWNPLFIDLMRVWACGAYRAMEKLDTVAKFLGCGGKPDDIDGGMFAGLWADPATHQQAVEYLKNDLAMTAAVARKMGVC